MIRRNSPNPSPILVDTNVHLRLIEPSHALHSSAVAALDVLRLAGERTCVVPQIVYEFWAVATRPVVDRGLGFSTTRTLQDVNDVLAANEFADDEPAVFAEWLRLVVAHDVKGLPAHDARLVAAMNVHGIGRLLTFNFKHFARYRGTIDVLDPAVVAASGNP